MQQTPKPKYACFRCFQGARGRRAQTLPSRATFPSATSRNRRESGTGPQGERTQKRQSGDFGTALRAPKVAFSARYRGPKMRSTRKPTPRNGEPKMVRNIARKLNFAPFFSTLKFFFRNFLKAIPGQKQGAPKTPPDAKPAETKRFHNFRSAAKSAKPQKPQNLKSCEGAPNGSKKRSLVPFLVISSPPERRENIFSISETSENPYFCSTWASAIRFGLFAGSFAAVFLIVFGPPRSPSG